MEGTEPVCTLDASRMLKYNVMVIMLMKTHLSHCVNMLIEASCERACVTHAQMEKCDTDYKETNERLPAASPHIVCLY